MKGRNLLSTTKVDDNQHTTTNRDDTLVEWPLLGADLEKNGGMGRELKTTRTRTMAMVKRPKQPVRLIHAPGKCTPNQ